MFGALITILVGLSIKRLWPTGIAFLLVFPALSLALGIAMRKAEPDLLGRSLDLSASALGQAYLTTALMHALIFFIAFGLSRLFSKVFRKNGAGSEEGNQND